ncbi:HBL123Cp [Eremothecium sinecaudum]|uniref:HBL123Cp n=1 Tax=Eremothecium sinecaudum TaxID=45286 RepID=A0A120K0X0_9SACH|nr:HBL123Cp [Eremothecium sinecaudum]AMD18779.1 HBL123Cp [Eremothecium sinecaudum]
MSKSSILDGSIDLNLAFKSWSPIMENSGNTSDLFGDYRLNSDGVINTPESTSFAVDPSYPFALRNVKEAIDAMEINYDNLEGPDDAEFSELMKTNDEMMIRIDLLDKSTQKQINRVDNVLRTNEPRFFSRLFPKITTSVSKCFHEAANISRPLSVGCTAEVSSSFVAGQMRPSGRPKRLLKRMTSWLKSSNFISDLGVYSYIKTYNPPDKRQWRYSQPEDLNKVSHTQESRYYDLSNMSPRYNVQLNLLKPYVGCSNYHMSYAVPTPSRHVYEKLKEGVMRYHSLHQAKEKSVSPSNYRCALDDLAVGFDDEYDKKEVSLDSLEKLGIT